MNSFPSNKGLSLAVSLLAMASTGEAFSVSSKLLASSPRTHTTIARKTLASSFGSLRDLVDGGGDGTSNNGGVNDGPRPIMEFGNLVNFSRSKFSDTKFRSRNVRGTGSDEKEDAGGGGMSRNVDRLGAFSFATRSPKSQSEGSASYGAEITIDERRRPADDEEDVPDEVKDYAADGPSMGGISRRYTAEDDTRGGTVGGGGYHDTMVADNFNNMVGTFYSKRKFPSRMKDMISDAKDERGLHGDRLSTFSFSSNRPMPKKNNPVPEDYADDSSDEISSYDVTNFDESFGVDNFHNLIDVSMSKPSHQANRPDPSSAPDGLDNHADRLSTFSLSSTKEDVVPAGVNKSGPSGGTPPKTVNHDDRLGTFSFASTDPQSGSTSGGSTSATSPLPGVGETKISPPGTKAGGGTAAPRESNEYMIVAVHASPPKGSLSSIASSVSIKSRNDRIKDIKEATDPRLLHPDGMNVPRLNSKGDVMTLSSTGGRLNIFQRIDRAKQEIEGEGDDALHDDDPPDINDGAENDTNGPLLEDIADV